MLKPFVTIEDFAKIACMDGFVVGVRTGCDSCDYMLNPCLRRNLRESLLANQHKAEAILGHDLQVSYHSDEILWNGRSKRLRLSRRGVTAIGVKQVTTLVDDSPFLIDYLIEDNLATADVGGNIIVTIPDAILGNPSDAIIRDHTSNGVQLPVNTNSYPRKVGTDWLIQIDGHSTFVDVYSCKYATVTVDTIDCEDGEIVALYPGTEDYIPFAKDPIVDSLAGTTTYIFDVWSLVNRDFREDEEIDLTQGQYYKMLSYITLACLTETAALPVVMSGPDCCDGNFTTGEQGADKLAITLLFADGVVEVIAKNAFICNPPKPIKITIFYKTDPSLLNIDTLPFKEAITYLTAAELTTKVCNCPPPKYGFIHQAQEHYGTLKINPFTGVETWQLSYGDMHGQIKFAQILGKAKKSRETLVL